MTDIISDLPTTTVAIANAAQAVFDFPFRIFDDADLTVTVDGEPRDDYVVSFDDDTEGGNIAFLTGLTLGQRVVISRDLAIERISQFPNSGPVPMATINREFNRMVALIQDRRSQALRALMVSVGSTALAVGNLAGGNGMALGIVGDEIVPVPNDGASFAAAAAAAKAEIEAMQEAVAEDTETVTTLSGQVATNAGNASAAAAAALASQVSVAAALELAMDFVVGERRFKKPTLAAAITQGLANVAESESFAATGDDVIYVGIYRKAAGVASELWKAPKFLSGGSVLPRSFTFPRSIELADALQAETGNTVTVQFGLPTGMLGTIRVPANAAYAMPINTTIEFLFLGGNDVQLVPDAGVTIVDFIDGTPVMNEPGGIYRLRKTAIDTWMLFPVRGNLGVLSPSAWNVPYLVHLTPELCRQEFTGAAATTPVSVGDPVGTVQLIGSAGGYMVATGNARRPTLQQDATGRYYLKFNGSAVAGEGNFMRIAGSTLNMATLKFVVGFRAFSIGSAGNSGIVTFGTSATGTTNRNDGGHFGFSFNRANLTARFGDPAAGGVTQPNIAGIYDKRPCVVEYEQPGSGASAAMRYERLLANQNGAPTGLTNMTGYILFGCQHGNNPDGAAFFSEIGLYSFAATDAALTTAQKNALRDYAVTRTRAAYPVYPVMPDIAARNAARTLLNTELYGGGGALPTDTGTLAAEDRTAIGFASVTGIANWQKMTLPGVYSAIAPRLITPTVTPNGRTVLCWIGHTFQLKDYGVPHVVLPPLLAAGYRVILLAPPGGPNDYTAGDPSVHDTNEPALKIWTGAASIAMNTVEALFPGEDFYMHGISGGGWAATICQASDARIIGCTQFVGTLPDFVPLNRDWEQRLPGLTANYFDLYLLAASNGWHVHTSYTLDTAGFNQAAVDIFGIDWGPTIAANAAALGGSYDWTMRVFNAHAYDPTIYAQDFVNRLPA